MIRSSKSYVFVIIRNAARETRKNSVINTRFVDIKILKMFKYSRKNVRVILRFCTCVYFFRLETIIASYTLKLIRVSAYIF